MSYHLFSQTLSLFGQNLFTCQTKNVIHQEGITEEVGDRGARLAITTHGRTRETYGVGNKTTIK